MIEISAEMVCTYFLGVVSAYLLLLLFNQLWAWHDEREMRKFQIRLRNVELQEAVADRDQKIAELRKRLSRDDEQKTEVDNDKVQS